MKKIVILMTLAVFCLVLSGIVSACAIDCPIEKTSISGKVYNQADNASIWNADVEVICHGESGDASRITKTGYLGNYFVIFSQDECDFGDSVTVNAQKDGLTGTSTGTVDKEFNKYCLDMDIGVINVPLIPEFGVVVGILTMASAIGVFFIVRRK